MLTAKKLKEVVHYDFQLLRGSFIDNRCMFTDVDGLAFMERLNRFLFLEIKRESCSIDLHGGQHKALWRLVAKHPDISVLYVRSSSDEERMKSGAILFEPVSWANVNHLQPDRLKWNPTNISDFKFRLRRWEKLGSLAF